MLTEPRRKALYAIIPAVMALLLTYGVIDESQAAVWSGLAIAILGFVMAFVNTNKPYGKHAVDDE